MRVSCSFCLLISAIFLAKPVLGQNPQIGIKNGVKRPDRIGSTKKGRDTDQRGSKELPLVVDTEGHQKTKDEKEEAAEKEDRAQRIEDSTLLYTAMTAWSTLALVGVGLVASIAAFLTLRAIRNQVDLQVQAMEQWVDLQNWRSELIPNGKDWWRLNVYVEIINPTNFPLKLPQAKVRLIEPPNGWTEFQLRDNHLLTPRNPELVRLLVSQIGPDRAAQYNSGVLLFQVEADLSHIGVLRKLQNKPVKGTLYCGRSKTWFQEETQEEELLDRNPQAN